MDNMDRRDRLGLLGYALVVLVCIALLAAGLWALYLTQRVVQGPGLP